MDTQTSNPTTTTNPQETAAPVKPKENEWKLKAIKRRLENKELLKRVEELMLSRDNWKEKFKKERQRCSEVEYELRSLKKKMQRENRR